MALFGNFGDKLLGNMGENIWKGLTNKDTIGLNLITGGAYGILTGQAKTASDTMKDFKYRNGGKAAEQEMIKTKEAAGLAATQQAQSEFEKSSKLASMAYASGGSNLQSFTNKSQTKKSILGSF